MLVSLASVAAFWGISVLFVITPGADWAYAITAGLGNRSPLPAVLGMLAGHLLATLIVAAGLGLLIAGIPIVLTVLIFAGALYLVWLGIGLLRSPATGLHAGDGPVTGSAWAEATKGLGISGLNPKVFLLFLALLPQFADPTTPWPTSVQMTVLGFIHVANCAVVYLLVAYSARRVLGTRPTAARTVARVSGIAMILIGTILLIEKILTL